MSTYKLIQDIEAEDKILGPLTLRQFIFALIAIFLFYVCFLVVVKHVVFLLVVFLPPALFFGFFALPFGRDQPTEIWALAKLRFWFKPRRRIWNQSGVKELVTITVPKKVERVLTNGLSQSEVKSRLQALADTIDSRGWATKNVSPETYSLQPMIGIGSDRLIDISSLPREVPSDGAISSYDILDETSSPIARQFKTMINQSSQTHHRQLIDQLNGIREGQAAGQADATGNDTWFMPRQVSVSSPTASVVPAQAGDPRAEAALSARLSAQANLRQGSLGNLRTMRPTPVQAPTASVVPVSDPGSAGVMPTAAQTVAPDGSAPVVTAPSDPAILSLAKNDDLNVATLAREAHKNRGNDSQQHNEVIVSLR